MEAYGVPFDHMDEHWTLRQMNLLILVRNQRMAQQSNRDRASQLSGRAVGANRTNGNDWMMAGRPASVRELHAKSGVQLSA